MKYVKRMMFKSYVTREEEIICQSSMNVKEYVKDQGGSGMESVDMVGSR